jgi:hypothetical protein
VCWTSEFLKHFHPRLLISTVEISTPRTPFHFQCSLTELTLTLVSVISCRLHITFGSGSVVGVVTGYGLGRPGIEYRWGRNFSAPVQTGPGAHPASCTMGTRSFPGAKSGRGVTLTPHPLLVPLAMKD